MASTAEILMRSRYTAYVLRQEAYLLRTWHPSTRPLSLELENPKAVKWLGLRVLGTTAGSREDAQGWVEFIARYKVGGRATRLHEVSRFVMENGEWFYVSGEPGKGGWTTKVSE